MTHRVLVIGSGIAGCSAAYQLVSNKDKFNKELKVSICDPFESGTLTSSSSTECFRNWWTEKTMIAFVKRSIEIYEKLDMESQHSFGMTRPGYLFLSASTQTQERYKQESLLCESLGAGPSRIHDANNLEKYEPSTSIEPLKKIDGIDVLVNASTIEQPNWPKFKDGLITAKHVRNCGWIYVQEYLNFINSKSVSLSVDFLRASVSTIHMNGQQNTVEVGFSDQTSGTFDQIVFAVGPMLRKWFVKENNQTTFLQRIVPDFKLTLEIHAKVVISDPLGVVPRGAPLILFDDGVVLPWSEEQKTFFQAHPKLHYLLEPFRGGVHFRPQGGENSNELVAIWTYNLDIEENDEFPLNPAVDEYYGEIVLRGLSCFIPGLSVYLNQAENPTSDSNPYIKLVKTGYYCKTPENRPLIGPVWEDDQRVLLLGALSGFGIMTAPAAGELISQYVLSYCNQSTGNSSAIELPSYAKDFLLQRYNDPQYTFTGNNHGQL